MTKKKKKNIPKAVNKQKRKKSKQKIKNVNRRKKPKKVIPKKKKLSRYNRIQKIVSNYGKDKEVKIGKDFNKITSWIHSNYSFKKPPEPLSFIEKNIEAIIDSYYQSHEPEVEKEIEEAIPFYDAIATFSMPEYEGVNIGIAFESKDGEYFEFTGTNDEFPDWYVDSGLFTFLRKNYNSSPVAVLVLVDTDKKNYAVYTIETGEATPSTPITKKTTSSPSTASDKELNVRIEEAKAKKQSDLKENQLLLKEQYKDKIITKKEYQQRLKKLYDSLEKGGEV